MRPLSSSRENNGLRTYVGGLGEKSFKHNFKERCLFLNVYERGTLYCTEMRCMDEKKHILNGV